MAIFRDKHLFSVVILLALAAGIVILSQFDNLTISKIYGLVSGALHINLKEFKIDTVLISNAGHIVAGFVLCGLAQLINRRWWVLPLALLFFLGLEGHKYPLSSARQVGLMSCGGGAAL